MTLERFSLFVSEFMSEVIQAQRNQGTSNMSGSPHTERLVSTRSKTNSPKEKYVSAFAGDGAELKSLIHNMTPVTSDILNSNNYGKWVG